MAELLNGAELRLSDRSVIELKVLAERTGQPDGAVQGFGLVAPPPRR
jgi:hypothetical protein